MKSLLTAILKYQAELYLKLNRPFIIAITGSYGKTTTKDAIVRLLADSLPESALRFPEKSFNNEFGIPLTILGIKSPGRSIVTWLKQVIFGWFILMSDKKVEVLVLEVGADHPGDISKWSKVLSPDIAVITGISEVHAVHYDSIDQIFREKWSLTDNAKTVIVNTDDIYLRAKVSAYNNDNVLTYGGAQADIKILETELRLHENFSVENKHLLETVSEIALENKEVGELKLRNSAGRAPALSALVAVLVYLELQSRNIFRGPKKLIHEILNQTGRLYAPTPGRLRPLAGIKNTLIIDDTYNASPVAVEYGLRLTKSLRSIHGGRLIVAIGDMAELGIYSEDKHVKLAEIIKGSFDKVVLVGQEMHKLYDVLKDSENVEWFSESKSAGRYLDRELQEGDIVYVKGSQSMRMEHVVKDLMADPLRAGELLVRQEEKWLK